VRALSVFVLLITATVADPQDIMAGKHKNKHKHGGAAAAAGGAAAVAAASN
jgi:hypothetical protein